MPPHQLPTDVLTTCTDGLLYCFALWASTVTIGTFWVFALLAFSFALFMATIRFGTTKAFGFGTFAGLLGAVWLAILQLIPWWVASTFILVGVIGLAMMILSEK